MLWIHLKFGLFHNRLWTLYHKISPGNTLCYYHLRSYPSLSAQELYKYNFSFYYLDKILGFAICVKYCVSVQHSSKPWLIAFKLMLDILLIEEPFWFHLVISWSNIVNQTYLTKGHEIKYLLHGHSGRFCSKKVKWEVMWHNR